MSEELLQLVRARASAARIPAPDDSLAIALTRYLALLAKWNARINLTSLPLDPPTPEAVDRLIVEGLTAAPYLPAHAARWIDLGSGAGSPALPMLMAFDPPIALTLVEAKARKAAFLREALRSLMLTRASVANTRLETLAAEAPGSADVVTVRAVNVELAAEVAATLLRNGGTLLMFRSDDAAPSLSGFRRRDTVRLSTERSSYLARYERTFHVEQN